MSNRTWIVHPASKASHSREGGCCPPHGSPLESHIFVEHNSSIFSLSERIRISCEIHTVTEDALFAAGFQGWWNLADKIFACLSNHASDRPILFIHLSSWDWVISGRIQTVVWLTGFAIGFVPGEVPKRIYRTMVLDHLSLISLCKVVRVGPSTPVLGFGANGEILFNS